jgi:23S rRNA pseudouridine1911/1915/1917 synthase
MIPGMRPIPQTQKTRGLTAGRAGLTARGMDRDEKPEARTVSKDEAGMRLDAFVAAAVPGLSVRAAKGLVERGLVTVDGRTGRKGERLAAGSLVEIAEHPATGAWLPEPDASVPLRVVLEDPHLLVVDKPSGAPSVPLAPGEKGTLAGAVAARFPECRGVGRCAGDGGLLQRLDTETSGLVIVARSGDVLDRLVRLQDEGAIEKRYLALVRAGRTPIPALVDAALGSCRGGRMVRPSPDGVKAITRLRPVRDAGPWRLVEALIHRGARHQIRAHLALAGFPIAGDPLYGGEQPPGLDRLFLHAISVRFPHPILGRPVDASSPLPSELFKFVESLENPERNV